MSTTELRSNPHPSQPPWCWTAGMTKREFFNANVRCGQWPPMLAKGCGANNWRVFSAPWMVDGEQEIICQNCGARCDVEVPEWRKVEKI